MKHIIILALLVFSGCSYLIKKEPNENQANNMGLSNAIGARNPANTNSVVTCSLQSDLRTLEVAVKGSGCELKYNKLRINHIAASSANGSEHCINSKNKIISHLKAAGFTCN